VRILHEPLGDQVRDAGLALHLALHAHEPDTGQGAALALGELLDDEVDLAGLVLQRTPAARSAAVGPETGVLATDSRMARTRTARRPRD